MSDKKTFQAEVAAGISTPGAPEAQKIFDTLVRLTDTLEGSAKEAGKALVTAFEAGKKPAELASQIRILKRELQFLGTVSGGTDLFKDTNVSKINEINRAISAAAKAYDGLRESEKLSKYELGLESKTMIEAASAMSTLERNIKAVDMALKNNSGNDALIQKQKLLSDNKALLEIVIKDLKQQAELERQIAAQQKGNALNASGERQMQYTRRNVQQNRDAQDFFNSSRMRELNLSGERQEQLRQKRAQEIGDRLNAEGERQVQLQRRRTEQLRRETEGSASAQTRAANTALDYSQTGRDYAAMRNRISYAGIQNSLLPGQEDMALQRLRDTTSRGYLNQAYRDAGLSQSPFTATLRDGPQVRALISEIRTIEQQIVQQRERGNVDLQNELRLLGEIRTRAQRVETARYDQNLNDPQRRQARQDSQSRNLLNRASGEGGAALLAVQASVMANYSILNSGVGAMKQAVAGSIELEAAFRNVQAVTGTTNAEMGKLEHTIETVAAASKFSSKEVADAALILGQAGLSAKQVGEALQPVVMLASAAGTNIANAVDLVTSIIGVFDKNTSDIADIANKVTQAANASKVSVEKLGLGFQYAGNAAAASGINFEETTAAMAAMSNAGIKNGSTMGTGLRQFITETQKPTKEFLASLQRVGLSISDIDFKSHGLIGVTQRLRDAGFTATDAIKSFDVRGAAAFNALIANPEELERQYRLLLDTQAGVQANEVQMDSLKSQSARLTTSLENLAAAGFNPLGRVLTATVGGFATLTQNISEHNVVVGVAGTALAGLAASGAASYLASMAGGALRLAQGAGAASTAVVLLQNASKAGSVGMLVNSVASGASALAAWTPAAAGATAASWTLAGAVNGVKTAFMGLSITTGIGLAVVAATAGYYAFNAVMGQTEKEIDRLKASTNDAKGAFEEKDQAVKSLSDKIEELTYKQSNLRGNQDALKTESMALTSQFGKIGYQADLNNISFDTMIDKLRKLKTEMSEIRKQSLETALAENRALLQKQTDKATDSVQNFATKGLFAGRSGGDLRTFMTSDNFKALSAAERQKVIAAQQQLAGGKLENMQDVSGATLILQKLMANMQAQGKGDGSSYERLQGVVDRLMEVNKSVSEVNNTKSDIARQEMTLGRDAAYKRYNESGRFGVQNGKPVTFEDSLPQVGSLEVMALQKLGKKTSEVSPLEIFEAAKKEQQERAQTFKARLEQLQRDAADQKNGLVTPEVFATMKQTINGRVEKDKGELLQLFDAAQDDANIKDTAAKRDLQLKLKNAKDAKNVTLERNLQIQINKLELDKKNRVEFNPKKAQLNQMNSQYELDDILDGLDAKEDRSSAGKTYQNEKRLLAQKMANAKMKHDKDAQKAIIRQKAELEIRFKNREEANGDRASSNTNEINAIRDQELQNVDDKVYGARGGRSVMPRITERTLRLQAEAKDAEADELKNSTKTATSMEELNEILDKAVAAKIEAKNKRLDALAKKQEEESKQPGYNKAEGDLEHQLQKLALVESENSKINSFATSFVGLLEAAMKRLDDVTKNIDAQKRKIAEDKWQGEDRVFEAQQELRELDLQMATGKKTKSDIKSTVTYGKSYAGADFVRVNPDSVTVNDATGTGTAKTTSGASASAVDIATEAKQVSGAIRETLTKRRNRLVMESTKIELEENEKLLEQYGDDTTGLIGNMSKAYKDASERVNLLTEEVKKTTDDAKKTVLTAELDAATKQQAETFRDLRQAKTEQKGLRRDNYDIRKRQAENTEALPQEATLDNLMAKLDDVWAKYQDTVGQMNVVKVVGDGLSSVLGNTSGQLGNAFASIVTGTKSVKEAFKDMSVSVIKAMIDILAQALAMQAVKGLMSWIGIGMSVGAPAAAPAAAGASGFAPTIAAATGGFITPGGIQRQPVRKMAGGGNVTGGTPGRDSVPTLLMPGEFVMKKQAVDAVGTDYLHSLNAATTSVVSQSSPVSSRQDQPQSNGVVNVWLVSPDQKPASMGPKDVVMAITDDINRNGPVKQLVKQIVMGQA